MVIFSRVLPVCLAGLVCSAGGFAATPDAGSLLQQRKLQEQRVRTPLDVPVREEPSQPAVAADERAQKVLINGFRFTGNITAFSQADLQALVQDAVGRSLTLDQLRVIVQQVTRHYRDQGYFLARAFLPAQDVTEGLVTIEIQEGNFDSSDSGLQLKGELSRTNDAFLRSVFLGAMPQGDPMQQGKLERAILLANRFPGLDASANLEAGELPGSTRVVVSLLEGPPAQFSAIADNGGNRYTGAERLTFNASINGLSGYADQLSFSANASNADNTYWMINYDSALGHKGWRGGASFSRLEYELGKELSALRSLGYAEDLNFHVSYPVILEQFERLDFNANVDFRDLEDRSAGMTTRRRDIKIASVSVNWQNNDSYFGGGLNRVNAGITLGDLDLSGVSAAYAADRTGPRTHGQYSKLTYGFSRLQRVSNEFTLLASLAGQLAAKNLDSSEELQMGGPGGVRAYPVGEASCDEGVKLTLEGRYILKRNTLFGNVQASVFLDHARLRQHHDTSRLNLSTPNSYELRGWGVGLLASNPGKSHVSLMWANKIGNNPLRDPLTGNDADGRRDDSRLWITASLSF